MELESYKNLIQNLLPKGFAWPRQRGSNMEAFINAISYEFKRTDDRIDDLLREAYPLTSSSLLPDWERITGLPDDCEGAETTVQRRREAVDRKLSSTGGQSPGFYIATAARLGYEITITEFTQFRCGINTAGDPVCGDLWADTWQVNAPEVTVSYFAAGVGAAGEPLADWGNGLLECVMNKLKPAHTTVLFAYSS